MRKLVYIFGIALFLFGCAPTFQYKGITYPDAYQALNVQKNDLKNREDFITPRQKNYGKTTKIILPSFSTIKKYGVVRGPLTPAVSVEYIAAVTQEGLMSMIRSLKKRNLFAWVVTLKCK